MQREVVGEMDDAEKRSGLQGTRGCVRGEYLKRDGLERAVQR